MMFFDDLSSPLSLVYCLSKQGINCVGNVQKNRLSSCRLADKKDPIETAILRRTYEERICLHDGVDFTATVWKDSKIVTLLSTYISSHTVDNTCPYDS